jgi:glycosyltransferase involved in cell wall biosynthesis
MSETINGNGLPKLSIVIVTYNAAADLQNCLDSIYLQKYPAIEIIVMDGQSTDGTADILKKNADKIAFWKSEEDDGIYDAMNKALEFVTGDWVYFLGADDILLDEFSDMAYRLKDKSTIYYGSVYKEGKKYLGRVDSYKHAKITICHQAMMYPAMVFKKYKFDTQYRISADHVLNMWCWKDKDFKFEFVDYIIAIFNDTGVSSTKKDLLFEQHKADLIKKNYGTLIWLRFLFKEFKAKRTKRNV